MRSRVLIGAVALAVMVAQDAVAQDLLMQNCHGACRWGLIVRNPALATQDLYPASDTREDCERIIAQFRAAHPDRAAASEMECIDNSRPDTWPNTWPANPYPDPRPSK